MATWTTPGAARLARRMPRSRSAETLGTLTLSTPGSGRSSRTAMTCRATAAAADHSSRPSQFLVSSENAAAGTPCAAAVRAAPTVPECMTPRPRFGPLLIPDSTNRGLKPNASRVAAKAMKAGVARTAYAAIEAATPGSSVRSISIRLPSQTPDSADPLPEASPAGAAMTGSRPAAAAAAARCHSPSLATPSSLVTSTRGRAGSLTGACRVDLGEAAPRSGQPVAPPRHVRPRIGGVVKPPGHGADGEPIRRQPGVRHLVPVQRGGHQRVGPAADDVGRDDGLRVGIAHDVGVHPAAALVLALLDGDGIRVPGGDHGGCGTGKCADVVEALAAVQRDVHV